MPVAQQSGTNVDARRFAALLAGYDLGNGNEEEALGKARALRRMAVQVNMRIVDLLELPDVRAAIDRQMQPARNGGDALREASERVDALRDELTERMRDVRQLAERVREREETIAALRKEAEAESISLWRFLWGLACLVGIFDLIAWVCLHIKENLGGN